MKRLWIGNARDARDVRNVLALGIEAVVDLAIEEPPIQFPRDIISCRFPLLDGEGNSLAMLRSAIDATANLISNEVPTLIACSGGMSRSPIIVAAAAYAKLGSTSIEETLKQLSVSGPCDVSPALLRDIRCALKRD